MNLEAVRDYSNPRKIGIITENPCTCNLEMYRITNKSQEEAENFDLPFGGRLSSENRWVRLAKLIPWSEFETEYASQFSSTMGAPAKSFRMALGALIIKELLGTSDEETVEQIKENPYLQYFLGLTKYTNEWDNFNESKDFQSQIEQYQQRFGYYPESVHIDRIYRTRDNRAFCKERKIRISAPPLGRPPAKPQPEIVKQQREDERFRNAIEGKFGQAKRRFSLGRIMAQLSNTAETTIAITFLVMNLELFWKQFFIFLFGRNYDFSSLKNNLIKPLF